MGDEGNGAVSKTPDMDTYALRLRLSDLLREPVIRSAVQAMRLPSGSRGLDAGCGIGSHTALLAEAVAPGGQVTGLDRFADLLQHARKRAQRSALADHVSWLEGDMAALPFRDATFDWAWSVDCVGFVPARPEILLGELARVVKPGGSLAVLLWSSQLLLPGHPLLEARLNATSLGIAPFAEGKRPERHFLRALGWFRDAGLVEPTARTFVGDMHAPLSDDVRTALLSLIQMRWGEPRSELSQEDWAEYQRLCQPESPDFILDLPDYYAFFTYSMFQATVP